MFIFYVLHVMLSFSMFVIISEAEEIRSPSNWDCVPTVDQCKKACRRIKDSSTTIAPYTHGGNTYEQLRSVEEKDSDESYSYKSPPKRPVSKDYILHYIIQQKLQELENYPLYDDYMRILNNLNK